MASRRNTGRISPICGGIASTARSPTPPSLPIYRAAHVALRSQTEPRDQKQIAVARKGIRQSALRPSRLAHGAYRWARRGIELGTSAVAIDATRPAYYGRGRLGSIRGMTFAAEIVGAALGPIPFGIVYDAVGS